MHDAADDLDGPPERPWLRVDSFDALIKHEAEILARIERTPNGGQLFLIHPFMLLEDIGVSLTDRAKDEIRRREPHVTGLSPVPYTALKQSTGTQPVQFQLQGLFRRRRP